MGATMLWWWWRPRGAAGSLVVLWALFLGSWVQADNVDSLSDPDSDSKNSKLENITKMDRFDQRFEYLGDLSKAPISGMDNFNSLHTEQTAQFKGSGTENNSPPEHRIRGGSAGAPEPSIVTGDEYNSPSETLRHIDNIEDLYSIVGENINGDSANGVYPRSGKGNDAAGGPLGAGSKDTPAPVGKIYGDTPASVGKMTDGDTPASIGNMVDGDTSASIGNMVDGDTPASIGNMVDGDLAPLGNMEYGELSTQPDKTMEDVYLTTQLDEVNTMEDVYITAQPDEVKTMEDVYLPTQPDNTVEDVNPTTQSGNLEDYKIILYNEYLPSYDVEDLPTYDVDEKDIPTVYQTKDKNSSSGGVSGEEITSTEEETILGLEEAIAFNIGDDLSMLGGFDIEDSLSKLGVGKEDSLSSLDSGKLDAVLELWKRWVKTQIAELYEEEVKRLDHTMDRIDEITNAMTSTPLTGIARSASVPYGKESTVPYRKERPVDVTTMPGEFWQPYIFDTGIGNRKDVKIKGVHVEGRLQGRNIAKIIPVNLPGMSILYVSHDGFGYVEIDGKLQRLLVLNKWTLSASGCQCGDDYSSKGCACCVPGGCLCQGASDTCVACGTEYSSCQGADQSQVRVSTAAGTVLSSQDGSLHLGVLAVTYGGSINFFSHVLPGASLKWVGSMTLQQEVTHLAFGTIFTDHDEATNENTFLVVFSSSATYHQFNEIIISSMAPTFTVGPPVKWQAKGQAMTIHQGDGNVLITVHGNNYIEVFTLQEDRWMKRHIIHEHTFKGAFHTWLVFQVDFETYIALAAQRHIVFYRWNKIEGEFEQFNTIYMGDSMSSIEGLVGVNVESCQEEVSVVVAGHGKHVAVIVLQYNFTTSTHSFVMEFSGSLHASLDWSIAAHHSSGTSRLVALEPGKGDVAVISVKTTVEDVTHPMGSEREMFDNTIQYIKHENQRQQAVIAAAESRLAQSVLFSTTVLANVTLTSSITISGVLSTGSLSAARLVFPGTDLEHGVTHLEYLQYLSSARPSVDHLKRLLQDIQAIEKALIHAVPASGPNRTVEGLKTIVATNRLALNSVVIDSVRVGVLQDSSGGHFPLNTTLSAIVRLDQTGQIIRGRKTFASKLSMQQLHTTFLDDIPTSDLVVASGRHNIAGAVFAKGLWAQEVKLRAGGTIGGLDLAQVVLLGQSAMLGRVTLTAQDFVARAVDVVSGMVGGFDLLRLYNHTLLVTGGQFGGSLVFTTDLTVEDLVAVKMMGIDMRRLAETIVFKDEDAVLTGTLYVTQPVTVGEMTTKSINGRQFPGDYAVKIGTSPLVFTSEVSFDNVKFGEVSFGSHGLVDGIAPHRLFTKSTPQTIKGRKVFTAGVDIVGHLDISTKLLDGVNLDDLFSRDGRPSSIPADWKFNLVCKRDIWIHRIFTKGTVNGIDLSALARDLIYRDEEQVKITGRKVFLSGLTVSNARFKGGFNGVDLGTLVTTDEELVINGVAKFAGDIFFKSLVASHVNGVDLIAVLSNALHLNKAGQVVTGQKVFLKPVIVGSLVIKGSLRGVDFRNFVTRSGNQTFTVPQVFKTANFSSLHASSIHVSKGLKINGVDLSELARRRMPLREPVSHTAVMTIEGPLEVAGTASIKSLNGVNFDELLTTIVTDDNDFTINGPVSLASLRVLGSVTTKGGVGGSGVSLRDLANNAIRLSANNQIAGHLSFARVEVRGELAVDGLVEGVHLGRLHKDAVYTDVQSLQTITGPKMFDGGFTVRGNIHTRMTNGVDLSKSLFTRTTDQVITAPVTFLHVSALKNVFLLGLFNNFDLKALAQESLMRGKNEEIVTKDITFSGRVTVKNLVLREVLHGDKGPIDVIARLTDAVRLQDTAITVTGKKIFTAGLSFGNMHVEILDGRKLDHFLALVVTRNRPHTLTGSVRVQGTIIAPWVTAQQLSIQGTIDGVNLQDLRKAVVFLTGHQSVDASLVFKEAVLVRGNLQTVLLNDISLTEGYLTTTTPQTLNVNFTLSSALASHVKVHGLVNSWKLPQEWNRTLLALGGQSMPGSLTLSGRVVVKGDVLVKGRVGRERMVKLNKEVVLLDRRTQVSGTLSFSAPLTVAWLKSSTGIVNGVDLSQLYKSAWFVDSTTLITTSVAFFGNVVIRQGFFSQGIIDGLEVETAYKEAKAAQDGFKNIIVEFETKFEQICLPIARLYNKLERCTYEGDYLSFHGSLPLPSVPHESISFYAFGTTVLLVSYEGSCHLDFMVWQGDNFVLHQRVQHTGIGRHFHLLQDNEDEVLVAMAVSSYNNTCEEYNSTIWQVTASGIQVYQKLGEGMYITEDGYAGTTLLLHNLHYTLSYNTDPNTHRWNLVATLPAHAGGVVVHPTYGVIHLLHDYTNATTYVRRAVPAISRGGVRLLFGLFSTVPSCHGPAHALKVFREIDGIYHCIAEAALPTLPADLTVFFAGSNAAGSHLAVVTMHYNHFPVIFSFAGEVLARWGELEDATTATWVQHAMVRRPGRHFPDYYILLSPLKHLPAPHAMTSTTTYQSSSPYTPPTTTSKPYNPYTPPTTTPPNYNPYIQSTINTHDRYTAAPADRYVRSAYLDYTTGPDITAIFRLVMRGSAVAAANITCTRSRPY